MGERGCLDTGDGSVKKGDDVDEGIEILSKENKGRNGSKVNVVKFNNKDNNNSKFDAKSLNSKQKIVRNVISKSKATKNLSTNSDFDR